MPKYLPRMAAVQPLTVIGLLAGANVPRHHGGL